QVASHHHPLRRILAFESTRFQVVKGDAYKTSAFREICENRFQVQTAVRDVEREHPALGQLRQVKIERLFSNQMYGDGVGAERVDNNHSVMARLSVLQIQSRVAFNHVQRSTDAVLQIGKVGRVARE